MSVSWLLVGLELVIADEKSTWFLCFLCILHVLFFCFISFFLDCFLLAVSLFISDYFSVLIRESTSTASKYFSSIVYCCCCRISLYVIFTLLLSL